MSTASSTTMGAAPAPGCGRPLMRGVVDRLEEDADMIAIVAYLAAQEP